MRGRRLRGASGPVKALAIAPDGSAIAAAGDTGGVVIWAAPKPESSVLDVDKKSTIDVAGGRAAALTFVGGAERLAIAASDKSVAVHNAADGKPVWTAKEHAAPVVSMTTTGETLISTSDSDLIAWTADGKKSASETLPAGFRAAALAGDGKRPEVVIVGANGNGFSLGSFGGLNEPRDIAYSRALSGWTGEVDLLRRSRVDGVNIHGGVGVRYDHEEHGLNFEAAIPGFARAVAYDQEIDVAAWSFMLIFGGDLMLDENFRASFEAAFGYVDADFNGFNELRFTGFANQRVEEDSGADGWRYEAELEIEYLLGENVSVGAFARAEGDNVTPYWDTPGGGARSRIETGRSDGYVVGLSLRYYVD